MDAECLARLLSVDVDATELREAFEDAGWTVPETGVVLCARLGVEELESMPTAWASAVPIAVDPPYCYAVVDVADEAALVREVGAVLRPERICVSPPVPVKRLSEAARMARRLHGLAAIDIVGDNDVLHCVDHEVPLWLYAEPALRQRLAGRLLGPLQRETPHKRRMLALTLLAWLERRRSANVLARELGVHPQTVRYRMRQLYEMFGDALEDPETSFAILLALKATLPLWTASLPCDAEV